MHEEINKIIIDVRSIYDEEVISRSYFSNYDQRKVQILFSFFYKDGIICDWRYN